MWDWWLMEFGIHRPDIEKDNITLNEIIDMWDVWKVKQARR
jgi:hypothetical protein